MGHEWKDGRTGRNVLETEGAKILHSYGNGVYAEIPKTTGEALFAAEILRLAEENARLRDELRHERGRQEEMWQERVQMLRSEVEAWRLRFERLADLVAEGLALRPRPSVIFIGSDAIPPIGKTSGTE